MVAAPDIPFGLDPTTFATLVALGLLLGTRIVEALLPKGRSFKFMERFLTRRRDEPDEDA